MTEAPIPRLTHAEAEAIGAALHDHFAKLGLQLVGIGGREVERAAFTWADAVQHVLRLAAERQAEREDG